MRFPSRRVRVHAVRHIEIVRVLMQHDCVELFD